MWKHAKQFTVTDDDTPVNIIAVELEDGRHAVSYGQDELIWSETDEWTETNDSDFQLTISKGVDVGDDELYKIPAELRQVMGIDDEDVYEPEEFGSYDDLLDGYTYELGDNPEVDLDLNDGDVYDFDASGYRDGFEGELNDIGYPETFDVDDIEGDDGYGTHLRTNDPEEFDTQFNDWVESQIESYQIEEDGGFGVSDVFGTNDDGGPNYVPFSFGTFRRGLPSTSPKPKKKKRKTKSKSKKKK